MRPRFAVHALIIALVSTTPAFAIGPTSAPTTQPIAERSIHVVEIPLNTKSDSPQLTQWLAEFIPQTKEFAAQIREMPIDPDDGFRLVRVTYPSAIHTPWPENNVVPAELYLPKKIDGKIPAVIVLDILDGSAVIPRGLARGMAEQGVAALYVPMACYGVRRPAHNEHIPYFTDHPDKTVENMRQTVMDIRRGKAILASLPEVDSSKISITGVSLGGIMTSLAAGVDAQFYRVVPILAGGDIATIVFHARETRQIRAACQAKGISQEQLETMLKPVDPLTFASRIAADHCLMVNGSQDEVIPKACTDALRAAIGSPQIIWVPAGHYRAILFLPDIRQRAIEYVQGKKVAGLKG